MHLLKAVKQAKRSELRTFLEKAKEQIKVKVEQVVQTKPVAYESSPKTAIGNSEGSKSKSEDKSTRNVRLFQRRRDLIQA